MFPLWVVVPAAFLDIFLAGVFPSSVFQRGEVRENAKSPTRPTFPPKNLWNKQRFEPAKLLSQIWTPCRIVRAKGRLKNSEHNTSLVGGKITQKKTTTPVEILLSMAADSGADANKTYNNQPHKPFHAYLGRVSLQFWVDWAAVALLVLLLVSGPFLRLWTLVDCYELHFLVQ